MVAFTIVSINGNHYGENLVLSGLPNIPHSMISTKLWGVEIDAVEYIPAFSFLILPSLFDQVQVTSVGSLFSLENFLRNYLL